MSDYVYVDDTFLSKDSRDSGDPLKVLQGHEFETEFLGIEAAIVSKLDSTGDTWTGTLLGPLLTVTTTLTVTGATVVGLTGGTF